MSLIPDLISFFFADARLTDINDVPNEYNRIKSSCVTKVFSHYSSLSSDSIFFFIRQILIS